MKPIKFAFACIALLAVLFVAGAANEPAGSIHAAEQALPVNAFYDGPGGVKFAFTQGPAGSYTLIWGSQFYTVTSADQPVPPGPGPEPQPDPLSGLAKDARDWASVVSVANRPLAKPLADAFEAIAAQIAAGTLATPETVQAASKLANRAALGDAGATAWMPWFEKLQVFLAAETKAGRMANVADIRTKWLDIAKGLRAVQ
jgi:hypothetical protein